MYIVLASVALGFVLDLILGDPSWLPHPVVLMGKLITALEKRLIVKQNKTRAGGVMVCVVCLVAFLVPLIILFLCYWVSPWLCLVVHTWMCFQILATKSLAQAAMFVKNEMENGLEKGREAVARIVGRDTRALSCEGVLKATVETVAENTTDAVIAPLFYLALGGAPLGFLYKAINTMDSMVGYRNKTYIEFGKVAAKTDDVANFIPARISAFLMLAASFLLSQNTKNAFKIWRRDRRKHASPNSAQTEAVCAGALGVQLAGDAHYFGQYYEKPTIGDKLRDITGTDVEKATWLMYTAAILGLALVLLLGAFWMVCL